MNENMYAVIDLGSNSFHMAVMQEDNGRILVVDRIKEMVQLGYGLLNGSPAPTWSAPVESSRSFMATAMFNAFFGGLGVDRFYLGKIGTGILKLLTGGGFGIWIIIDAILILSGETKDKQGLPLARRDGKVLTATVISIIVIALLSWAQFIYTQDALEDLSNELDNRQREQEQQSNQVDQAATVPTLDSVRIFEGSLLW